MRGLEAKLNSITPRINSVITKTRDYLTGTERDIFSKLADKDLRRYFEGIPEEERIRRESLLERCVGESIAKYDTELHGMRKLITKPSMLAAALNDIYSFVSTKPIGNFSVFSYILFGVKTIAEIPAMYRYLKKSHDWYGALKWAIMKPIDYIIPVIGPMIESGLFERIVKSRVAYEAKNRFLEAVGSREPETLRVKRGLTSRFRERLDPNPVPEYVPAYG